MSEKLYRVADRDALERLRASGVRILHRFAGGVVVRDPLTREIDGVTPVDPRGLAVAERVRPEDIGPLAFALRQSAAYRGRKARRPHVGKDINHIIAGTAGEYP